MGDADDGSGARLMASNAAAPFGPHEGGFAAATIAAGPRSVSALAPASAAFAVAAADFAPATEGGGPGGSGGAAPGGRGGGAAPASTSRVVDDLPLRDPAAPADASRAPPRGARGARPESALRPDPEDRPTGAPGGGGGAFGSNRARDWDCDCDWDWNAFAAPARGDAPAECECECPPHDPVRTCPRPPRPPLPPPRTYPPRPPTPRPPAAPADCICTNRF